MTDELAASRRAQLDILQTRVGLHGSRMWQLPLTYLGAIAISLNAASSGSVDISLPVVFYFVAALGGILLWCLRGAQEAYVRTAKNMNDLEQALGLPEYTNAKPSHSYPYYALMIFGILCCLVSGIYFSS